MLKDRNSLILQTATEGFWDWDLLSDRVYLSPRYLELLGNLTPDTVYDSNFLRSTIHPDDRARVFSIIDEHYQGKSTVAVCEYRLVSRNGACIWIESRGSVVQQDDAGKPARMVGTIIDVTPRKNIEEKLRLSEKKFFEAFHSSPDSININRLSDGTYLDVNEGFTRITGYSRDEVIGRSSLELNIWADPDDRDRLVNEIQTHGSCNNLEARFRCKDGSLITGSMSARIIEIDGETCVLNTTRDITRQTQEAENVRKSEALLRCIIDTVGDIIYVKDKDGVYLACNKAGVEYIGLPESEQIGKTDFDLFSHEQAAVIREADLQIMASGDSLRIEEWITRPDGISGLLETTKTPFYSSTGEMLGIVGVSRDITVKRQSEEELKNSHHLLQTIINTVPVRVFWKDRDSRYLGCNRAFAQDAGKDEPDELLGRDDFQLSWWAQAQAYRDDDRHVIESGSSKISYDEPQSTPDGGLIWLRTSKVPLRNESEDIIGVLGIYEDITQRKQIEFENSRLLLQKRAILDNLPMMAWLKDCDSRLILVNELYAQACGRTIDECIGKTDLDLFPEEMARKFIADDREVCRTGLKKQVEETITSTGGTRWHLTFKTPIRDERGCIIGTAGIAQDITDRRLAEEVIRESEKKFRLLSENVVDVIWSIDLQTMRFKYVSPSIEKLCGITQTEAMEKDLSGIMTPDSYQAAMTLLQDAIECYMNNDTSKRIQTNRFDIVHCDGHIIPTESVTTLITNEENRIFELLGVTRDITERLKSEQALRDSELRHSTLLKTVIDGIMVLGENGKILAANETYCRMSGYSELELQSMNIREIARDESEEIFSEVEIKLMTVGECRFESRHHRKDGTFFDVEVSIQHSLHTGQSMSLVRDISDRIRSEQALRQSEKTYRDLINSMNETVWVIDFDTSILDVNSAAIAVLGYTRDELLSMKIADIDRDLKPDQIDMLAQNMPNEKIQIFETFHTAKDGTKHPVEVSSSLVTYMGQTVIMSIARDITERKQAEAELQKKNSDLEQFTYTVSHDLRSPLVTMKTFLGYLEEDMAGGNGERISQDLQFIHTAADKMKTLLDELLELSRIDRVVEEPVPVLLNDIIEEALGALAGTIDEHDAEIIVSEPGVTLLGDRRRLCQIWQNLIENAIKYRNIQHPPRIEIDVRLEPDELIFCVSDNGIGIDPQYHEKVFGIFEKLDPKSPGAGLGLSMLKRIVNKSGGRIWVESAGEGHGSCFCFTLPGSVIS